jgi:hypothetical protein
VTRPRTCARIGSVVLLAVCAIVTAGRSAQAHLMPAKQGTLNVVDSSVYGVVSIPVSALHGFDDDGDGMLEGRELELHEDALRAEVGRRFVVSDGDTPGAVQRIDLVLSPEHDATPDRAGEVIALVHVRFPAAPEDLRLRCDLFGAKDPEGPLAIKATRHVGQEKEVENATLTAASPERRFFRPVVAASALPLGAGVAVAAGLLLLAQARGRSARRRMCRPDSGR